MSIGRQRGKSGPQGQTLYSSGEARFRCYLDLWLYFLPTVLHEPCMIELERVEKFLSWRLERCVYLILGQSKDYYITGRENRFSVKLVFAKFLSKIKGIFNAVSVSWIQHSLIFPFILDRILAKANCSGNRVCTSCDIVVLGSVTIAHFVSECFYFCRLWIRLMFDWLVYSNFG